MSCFEVFAIFAISAIFVFKAPISLRVPCVVSAPWRTTSLLHCERYRYAM
jgi:hypothetical protein